MQKKERTNKQDQRAIRQERPGVTMLPVILNSKRVASQHAPADQVTPSYLTSYISSSHPSAL